MPTPVKQRMRNTLDKSIFRWCEERKNSKRTLDQRARLFLDIQRDVPNRRRTFFKNQSKNVLICSI